MHAIKKVKYYFFKKKRLSENDLKSTSWSFKKATTRCQDFNVNVIIIETYKNSCFIYKRRDIYNIFKAFLRSHFQKQIWNIFLKVSIDWFVQLKCYCLTIERRWKCREKNLRFNDVIDDRKRVSLVISHQFNYWFEK